MEQSRRTFLKKTASAGSAAIVSAKRSPILSGGIGVIAAGIWDERYRFYPGRQLFWAQNSSINWLINLPAMFFIIAGNRVPLHQGICSHINQETKQNIKK